MTDYTHHTHFPFIAGPVQTMPPHQQGWPVGLSCGTPSQFFTIDQAYDLIGDAFETYNWGSKDHGRPLYTPLLSRNPKRWIDIIGAGEYWYGVNEPHVDEQGYRTPAQVINIMTPAIEKGAIVSAPSIGLHPSTDKGLRWFVDFLNLLDQLPGGHPMHRWHPAAWNIHIYGCDNIGTWMQCLEDFYRFLDAPSSQFKHSDSPILVTETALDAEDVMKNSRLLSEMPRVLETQSRVQAVQWFSFCYDYGQWRGGQLATPNGKITEVGEVFREVGTFA